MNSTLHTVVNMEGSQEESNTKVSQEENSKASTSATNKEEPPPLPNGWTRCHAYLSLKRRYCRQLPLDDANYCGNHRALVNGEEKRIRVPCPLDPSHTIYQDMVEQHLKKCPKAKNQQEQEAQPYYQFNANAGGHGTTSVNSSGGQESTETLNMDQAKRLARKVLTLHQELFGGTIKEISTLTQQDIEAALPQKDYSAEELQLGLAEAMESYHIRSGGPKHLQQQASLLGHLKRMSPIGGDHTLLLELGAGRGMLGLVAAGAFATTKVDLVMIERAGTRSKADTVLRNHQSTLEGRCLRIEDIHSWNRIQCDLAHVRMSTVLDDNNKCVLAIAKHLCGAGTDLALKALYPIRDQIQVCMMATCCHGVCSWEHYVGRDTLVESFTCPNSNGLPRFGAEEFDLLRLWSSGTVHDAANTNDNTSPRPKKAKPNDNKHCCADESVLNTTVSIKAVVAALNLQCGVQGLGRACQRLLDYGRKQYLEQVLFASNEEDCKPEVDLCYYVPPSVTPQNAVLMAWRKNAKK